MAGQRQAPVGQPHCLPGTKFMKGQFDITVGLMGLLLASRWVDTDTRHMCAHLLNLLSCFL